MRIFRAILRLVIRLVLTAVVIVGAGYASFLLIYTASYSEEFPNLGHIDAWLTLLLSVFLILLVQVWLSRPPIPALLLMPETPPPPIPWVLCVYGLRLAATYFVAGAILTLLVFDPVRSPRASGPPPKDSPVLDSVLCILLVIGLILYWRWNPQWKQKQTSDPEGSSVSGDAKETHSRIS